jgi:hypothetical protein
MLSREQAEWLIAFFRNLPGQDIVHYYPAPESALESVQYASLPEQGYWDEVDQDSFSGF